MASTKQRNLDDLFYDTLKDIYYPERKFLKTLPKMSLAATDEKLNSAFEKHREQTEEHVERLQQCFEILSKRGRGKTCDALEGIIAEGEGIIEEFSDSPALDAGLISSAVEHCEITRYGTLKHWAETLGHQDVAKLLEQTLQEKGQTDKDLTKLAESSANFRAEAA